jgi:signal transduction histidine kinase
VTKSLDALVVDMMLAASEPLVLLDSERSLLWANEPAASLLGASSCTPAPTLLAELPAIARRAVAELRREVGENSHTTGTVDLPAPHGGTRAAGFAALPLAGGLHLATLHDLGPGGQARHPAAARIAAAVGHEIRSPLGAALMYLEIAERSVSGGDGARAMFALDVAKQQIQRIESLMARVLEMHRLGHPLVRASLVDAGRVVSDAVHRVAEGDTGARISVEIGGAGLLDWWDKDALEQIVHNLLSNALKFGEGQPIAVAIARPEGDLRLSVRDGGVGIAENELERIFHHGVHGPAERSGGLGLGLWLVRQLAEAHAGEVGVESRPGAGSTFTVRLRPLRPDKI